MSDSNRLFGLVLREAGPVVPSTFLRRRGHKGSVVGHGRLQANGLRDGLRAVFFGFTMGGVCGSEPVASTS